MHRLKPRKSLLPNTAVILAMIAPLFATTPALAQDGNLEARVGRLEAEVRAVQRKVFPDSDNRFFEPDIQPETAEPEAPNNATNSAVADLLLRVDALEAQLATLTAQGEENGFRLGKIEEKLAAMEAEAVEAEETRASEERIAEVSSIVKPESGNAGEDDYIYGFRLWEAGYYPEAQQQLALTVEQHPDHRRISHARNLLGRAYLDDGKPGRAAEILFDNYQQDKDGARAPDSLLYLGQALIASGDNTKACAAFGELESVYPDIASGRLSDELTRGRRDADCS